jgi:hypothetical protein
VSGTHLGSPERAAEELEGGVFVPSCTRELRASRGSLVQILSASSGRVDSMLMFTDGGGVLC